jgi:predicted alpha/beta hydrolase family esterase
MVLAKISELMKTNNRKANCIIIHGCPSDAERAMNPKTRTYDKHWIPWIKKELDSNDIKTETPLMPEPWYPDYKKFKKEFEKYTINDNTILVGHSCGCAFLIRWLGETGQRVNKLILVAPWKIPDKNDKYRKAFYEYQIDKEIKSRVNEIIMFTSNDEEDDGKKSLRIFQEALGGKVIKLKKHGHYTIDDMGTEKFPELLEEIISD